MSELNHCITVEGGEVSFPCSPDDTILRSALRAGIAFPYECNVGACGNCKFQLVDGELQQRWHEAPAWSDKDRERGRFLGCQSVPGSACTIKVRPSPLYAPVHPPRRLSATFTQSRSITHDIREFHFSLDDPMPFEPGQYALLSLPGVTGERAYSMSNVTETGDLSLQFQVRRVPGGSGTAALFEGLQPGTRIEIDGPYGRAYLRRDVQRDIVCIAGGSGLAPMISIARGFSSERNLQDTKLHFLYGARTSQDICGRDMLEVLPGFGERIQFHAGISTPDAGDANNGATYTGFVHELADSLLGERLRDMEIYFAGPPAMGAAIQRMLLGHKVSFDRVHFDQFY
jgi:toluene monooxygenase electron transfer component